MNVFIGNIDEDTEWMISKSADDTKLGESVDMHQGREALQRDLNRLDPWASINSMSFHGATCQVLHLDHKNHRQGSRPEALWLERVTGRKGF